MAEECDEARDDILTFCESIPKVVRVCQKKKKHTIIISSSGASCPSEWIHQYKYYAKTA